MLSPVVKVGEMKEGLKRAGDVVGQQIIMANVSNSSFSVQ